MNSLTTRYQLSELGLIVGGGTPSTRVPENFGQEIPWITPRDLTRLSGRYIVAGERGITKEGLRTSGATVVPKGSIIVSSRAPIGLIAIAGQDLTTNQGCRTFVPGDSVDSTFMYYVLGQMKQDFVRRANGSTFLEISGKEFGRTVVDIPPLSEQRQIAATLGAIDDKIESNNVIQECLDQLNQAEFALAVASEVGTFVRFDQVVERLKVKPIAASDIATKGDYSIWDQGESGLLGYSLSAPTLMATIGNPVILFGDHTCTLRLAIEPCHIGPNLIPFRPKSNSGIKPVWLYFALKGKQKSQEYRRHWMELRQQPIVCLSEASMDVFISSIQPRLELHSELVLQNRKLIELRDSLLPELISGRIKVSDLAV